MRCHQEIDVYSPSMDRCLRSGVCSSYGREVLTCTTCQVSTFVRESRDNPCSALILLLRNCMQHRYKASSDECDGVIEITCYSEFGGSCASVRFGTHAVTGSKQPSYPHLCKGELELFMKWKPSLCLFYSITHSTRAANGLCAHSETMAVLHTLYHREYCRDD